MLLLTRDGVLRLADLLRRCDSLSSARLAHGLLIADQGFRYQAQTFVSNFLVEMYGRLGSPQDARSVFDHMLSRNTYSWNILLKVYDQNAMPREASHVFDIMPSRDVVSWTSIIMILCRHGYGAKATGLFFEMLLQCITPNKITFLCLLEACSCISSLARGQEIHSIIMLYAYEYDEVVGTALITMYDKCGCAEAAKKAFECILDPDIASWNAMIGALSSNNMGKAAVSLFCLMLVKGVNPDQVSFVCILNACFSLCEVLDMHSIIVKVGLEEDIKINNNLISIYGKHNGLVDAWAVFRRMPVRTVVSWNAILMTFSVNKYGGKALQILHEMQREGINLDKVTFLSALGACTSLASLEAGQEVHSALVESGYESDAMIENSMIAMYGSCHSLQDAKLMFDLSSRSDPVTWSSVIAVYSHANQAEEALNLFYRMHIERVEPNKAIFVCVIDACAILGAHDQGLMAHAYAVEMNYDQDMIVENALVNLYGKCGSLPDARSMFDSIAEPDDISWASVMGAYSSCGCSNEVLDLFYRIWHVKSGEPDNTCFTCVLLACNHDGRVDESVHLFMLMIKNYRILGNKDQYLCMVDLLGRSGCLDAAENLAKRLPPEHASSAWQCVLAACRVHIDVERGVRAAIECLNLDPDDPAPYILLSNLYASTELLPDLYAFFCVDKKTIDC